MRGHRRRGAPAAGGALGRYRAVLDGERVRRMLAASTLGRLSLGVESLAVLLYARERSGSFAVAGAAVAALTLCAGATAPLRGRALDRGDRRRVLRRATALHVGALALLGALGLLDAPAWALVAASALLGAAQVPILVTQRTLWPELLAERPQLLPAAYALDTLVTEIVLMGGPALVAIAIALGAPAAALALDGATTLAGTLWFVAALPSERAQAAARGPRRAALADRGVRTLLLGSVAIGGAFGSLDVALVAFGRTVGRSASLGGVLVATVSIGALAGGLVLGGGESRAPAWRRLRVALALPCAFAAMALIDAPVPMAALAFAVGVPIVPLGTALNELLGAIGAEGALNETYAWIGMAGVLASGAASGLAGVIVEARGWRADLLVTALLSGVLTGAFVLRGAAPPRGAAGKERAGRS